MIVLFEAYADGDHDRWRAHQFEHAGMWRGWEKVMIETGQLLAVFRYMCGALSELLLHLWLP